MQMGPKTDNSIGGEKQELVKTAIDEQGKKKKKEVEAFCDELMISWSSC